MYGVNITSYFIITFTQQNATFVLLTPPPAPIRDTANRRVQSRRQSDLSLRWEVSGVIQADCLTVAADKGHVYFTDYSVGPPETKYWMSTVTAPKSEFHMTTKFLIVADAFTGAIISNTTLCSNEG